MKPLFILAMLFVSIQNFAQQNKPVTMVVEMNTDSIVYDSVDVSALFNGGNLIAFQNWVCSNVEYPEIAIENEMQGTVVVEFVVNKNGYIENASIFQSSGFLSLDMESLRVIRKAPRWKPAQVGNRNVNQRFTLPLRYMLGY